jgi:hypothetical protein
VRIIPNRDYRLLVAGGVISQLGDWASRLALAVLVFERTGSATAVGLTAALLVLPWLGPGQWLAARGERLDRRRLLVACDVVRGLLFLVIALGDLPLPAVLSMVAVAATIDPVFEANRAALLVDVVGTDEYADAIQFNHAVDQMAQLVGYGVGGGLIAVLGSASNALAVNGLTFLVSALLLAAVSHRRAAEPDTATAPSLRAAWSFLVSDRLSMLAVVVTVVTVFAVMSVEAQAAVYGSAVAGLSGAGIGLLAATVPAATLVVLTVVRSAGDDRAVLRRGFVVAGLAGALAVGLLAVGDPPGLAFAGYAAMGGVALYSTFANIVVGRRIPSSVRATTFAVLQATVFIAISTGAVAGGALSDLFSPQAAAAAAAATAAIAALLGYVTLAYLGRSTQAKRTTVPG